MIKPIVLYNQEIWAADLPVNFQKAIMSDKIISNKQYTNFINNSPAEQVHLKYNRMVLGVKKYTPNIAVRAELGKYPLYIDSFITLVKYWLRLCNLPKDRLVVDALECNYIIHQQGIFSWASAVHYILEKTGFSHVWEKKGTENEARFLRELSACLKNEYDNLFRESLFNDNRQDPNAHNKLRTYRLYKTDHRQEDYLNHVNNPIICNSISKMRLGDHKLMIEKGRHLRIPAKDRICNKCNTKEVGDEYHAIMVCTANALLRTELYDQLSLSVENWDNISLSDKFLTIMQAKTCPYAVGKFFMSILSSL